MKTWRNHLLLIALLSFIFISQVVGQPIISGRVVGISDGDTITVLQDKTQYKIRLYGIDTPESGQDFGQKAKKKISDLVFGKDVRVVFDTTDRYGRTVGTVFVDSICVNEQLIRDGYAWVYRTYCDKPVCREWINLESQAQKNKAGLWSHSKPIPPWQFRKTGYRDAALSIVDAQQVGSSPSKGSQKIEAVFHGNLKSRVFHRTGCRYFNCKNCTAVFNSREEAINAGYRPCKICKP